MNKTRKKIPRCQLHWYRLKATKLPPCWTFTYIKTDIILPIHMQILRLSQVVFHTSGTVGWKLHVQVTTTWQAGKTFEGPILLRTCLLPTRINWILQHALAIDRSALTNFLWIFCFYSNYAVTIHFPPWIRPYVWFSNKTRGELYWICQSQYLMVGCEPWQSTSTKSLQFCLNKWKASKDIRENYQ